MKILQSVGRTPTKLTQRRGTTKSNTESQYTTIKRILLPILLVASIILTLSSTSSSNEKESFTDFHSPDFPYFGTSRLDPSNYQPQGPLRYVEWKDGDSPYHINDEILQISDALARERREKIKAAMQYLWDGYNECAFGYDEVQPVTCTGNQKWKGLATTMVDSLDTLWLMGMYDEFHKAKDWIQEHLNHDIDDEVSVFENTIRSVGGLLAAYDWSGEDIFLEKAQDLADRIFKAFESLSGIPFGYINLKTGAAANAHWAPTTTSIAEAGTLQLEYRYLAKVTKNDKYAKVAEHAYDQIYSTHLDNGLLYSKIDNQVEVPYSADTLITISGPSDSFYEYMLKQWLQGGKTEHKFRDMYDKAVEGIHQDLLKKSKPSGLVYMSKIDNGNMVDEFEHLECFFPGVLALGAYHDPLGFDSERAQRDLKTSKAMMYTCYQLYAATATGLGPETSINFNSGDEKKDFIPGHGKSEYMLRPEVVESLYILNKLTGDPIYREWGWEIFQSIEKHCKAPHGYGHYPSVSNAKAKPQDVMESFFSGETLKYLYLLNDPESEVDLGKHVFNTEAHPLRIFTYLEDKEK